MAEESLYLREGGAVVDQQSGVGVAEAVGECPWWGSAPRSAEPTTDQVVDGAASTRPTIGANDQGIGGSCGAVRLDTFGQIVAEYGGGFGGKGDRARLAALADHTEPSRVAIEVQITELGIDGF